MYSASFACDGHLGCLLSSATPAMPCTNANLHYVYVSLEKFQEIQMDGSDTACPSSAEREAVLARLSSQWQNAWQEQCEREDGFSWLMVTLPCLLVFTASPNSLPLGSKPSMKGPVGDILNANQNISHQSPEPDDHLIMKNMFHPSQGFPAPLRSSSPRFPWYLRWAHSYEYPPKTENKLHTV